MTPVLEAVGLCKEFRSRRSRSTWHGGVRDINLEVFPGETLAIVGESGAGKSTLGRLLLRLIEPDTGVVLYHGKDTADFSKAERKHFRATARMIFQDPFTSLDPRLQVGKSIAQPLIVHAHVARAARAESVAQLLKRVGLPGHVVDRYPYELSGGQLQRVALARAIATDPDLIVCDEPVSALDMSIRAHIINLLRSIQEQTNVAYVFVSHDLSLVKLIADRVIVLYEGEIVESGECAPMFANPKHPYTRELLSAVPIPGSSRRRSSLGPSGRLRPPASSEAG
jgi:peptide/nickel transport system ATP-binding protein/oligopeptide transport system ATP-binding protein